MPTAGLPSPLVSTTPPKASSIHGSWCQRSRSPPKAAASTSKRVARGRPRWPRNAHERIGMEQSHPVGHQANTAQQHPAAVTAHRPHLQARRHHSQTPNPSAPSRQRSSTTHSTGSGRSPPPPGRWCPRAAWPPPCARFRPAGAVQRQRPCYGQSGENRFLMADLGSDITNACHGCRRTNIQQSPASFNLLLNSTQQKCRSSHVRIVLLAFGRFAGVCPGGGTAQFAAAARLLGLTTSAVSRSVWADWKRNWA